MTDWVTDMRKAREARWEEFYGDEALAEMAKSDAPGPKREAEILARTDSLDGRVLVVASANRRRNMTGGRYSDALEAEMRHYLSGRLTWTSFNEHGKRLRELGY